MVEDFDIGPLTWVKDEIDQALKNVLENLTAVSANPADVSTLRFSQTHLYQVSGALDMVGLVGCKRFCQEIEQLAGKLEKKEITATPETLQKLEHAVNALSGYLQDLLAGAPDLPLRLFPALQNLAELQGETLEESELFFPDTSLRAPKDLPSNPLPEAEYPAYIAEQRALFQKALVAWLKTSSAEGLEDMRTAIANVQQVQPAAQRTVWWVAGAFLDALSQPGINEHPGVKRLCRRLDQLLRSNSEGASRASANLLRDLLYYIALSAPGSEQIARVKTVFELDGLLPDAAAQAAAVTGEVSAEEMQALEALRAAIEPIKETWASASEDKAGALDDFLQQLSDIIEPSLQLTNTSVANLFATLHEVATALDLDASKKSEAALIEVAAGLTLLEDSLQDYGRYDAKQAQLLDAQTQRLQDVMGGGPMSDMSGAPISAQLDDSILLAMAQQIRDALKLTEQALDTYFRNPGEQQVLQAAGKPLQQVTAAFDMLDMPAPTSIARICGVLVEHFRNNAAAANQATFELVAESLSMLDFYVEELPRTRPESLAALETALARLEAQLQLLDISIAESKPDNAIAEPAPTIEIAEQAIPAAVVADAPAAEPVAPAQAAAETVKDSALDAELLDIYLTETEEVLGHVAENLQALRINATDNAALVEVRRGFHTLKGSGRTVGLNALGEVAWAVEKLLNLVLERKVIPSPAQLTFIEEASASFAGWAASLRESGEAELAPAAWQQRAALLENANTEQPAAAAAEEVLIDGTRRLSRGLFTIFLGEAAQHMQALQLGASEFALGGPFKPSNEMRRAAHTLASNAGAAGFKPITELARALEHWLDAHQGYWTEQALSLLGNVVQALADMLEKAGNQRQPKPASGLVASLQDATIQEASAAEFGAPAADLEAELTSLPQAVAELPTISPLSADSLVPAEPVSALLEAATAAEDEAPIAQAEMAAIGATEDTAAAAPAVKSKKQKSAPATAADRELLTMFIEEARELVPQVGNELRAWRANPQETDHPDSLQRALHTLKGSARMAGQATLGDTVHGMEDRVMRALKNKVSSVDFDDLFAGLDHIGSLLEEAVSQAAGDEPQASVEVAAVVAPSRSADRRTQYLRLRADVLDRLINEAGEISIARARMAREMLNFKQFSLDLTESVFRLRNHLREMEIEAESQLQSRMTHLQETHEAFDPLEFDRFTRLQELTRMMAESVNDVATIQHGLLMNLDETESALQQQGRMNRELQHGLMDVRMVPFALISERLQRIVRQTARELDKRVEMKIDGEAVELDRSVLDKIGAPLEHLLRNAVAHGMETAAARKQANKPEMGSITLKVRQESDEIVLTVMDDGAGINLERVRAKAVERGLFSAEQEFSEQALMSVIFEPGFSTAADVTQIAGRGVGLDAVRSDITALGGRIDVSNMAGHGAVFSIYLPVTLSVAQVVMIRAGAHVFALPSVMVEQVQKLKPDLLAQGYENRSISWSGRQYPLHFLGKLIGEAEQAPEEQRYTPLLLLRSGTFHIALHVDEILGNQEVVMKPIGLQLSRVPGMVGATVMGDGSIILILNPVQLANREMLSVGHIKAETVAAVEVSNTPVVMVVDDSLTMRKVLGRLLEREGYQVVTAKDGMDALQKLQESPPDIMLTDIEMPRMDGFELARNVRDDSRMADMPLIIISSRTAEKHRNLARDIGVNAFMGKPVQDEELIAQITALLDQRTTASLN